MATSCSCHLRPLTLSSPSISAFLPSCLSTKYKRHAVPRTVLRHVPRVTRAEVGKAAEQAPPGAKPRKSKISVDRNAPVRQSLVERTEDAMAWREYRQKMEGDEKDFWEGSQWNAFGFFLQYMWAFGIVFAAGASVYAVRTYNEGAEDYKATEAFKAALESSIPAESVQPTVDFPSDDAPPL